MKLSSSILTKGVEGLSNREVIQILADIIAWLHAHFKSPAWSICLIEELFAKFMMLSYSNLYDEYMTEIRNGKVIQGLLKNALNNILRFSA